jgi:anti-repressor protein
MTPEKIHEMLSDTRKMGELCLRLADEIDKNKALTETVVRQAEKITEDAPKVSRTDSVIESGVEISMGTMAAILKQNGRDIGTNRLFVYLRDNGYLVKQQGKRYNLPPHRRHWIWAYSPLARLRMISRTGHRGSTTPQG